MKKGALLIWMMISQVGFFVSSQNLLGLYNYDNDTKDLRFFLFEKDENSFVLPPIENHYLTQATTLADTIYYPLSCTADFDGDGADEMLLFTKRVYTPNCMTGYDCPPYAKSDIQLFQPYAGKMVNQGSCFSILADSLDFASVISVTKGYFNADNAVDVAIIYHNADTLSVRLLINIDDGFQVDPVSLYLQVDSIFWINGVDVNADNLSDLLFTSADSLYVSINNGVGFDKPVSVFQLPDSLEFLKSISGKFTDSANENLLYLVKDSLAIETLIISFSTDGDSVEDISIQQIDSLPLNHDLIFVTAADINVDSLIDIVYIKGVVSPDSSFTNFYTKVVINVGRAFDRSQVYYSSDIDDFNFYKLGFVSYGNFISFDTITVTKWQGNKAGALTFSFDDGYTETIAASKYLYTKGLRGTHNIVSNFTGSDVYASWGEIEADSLGNEYASHSYEHNRLNQIPLTQAVGELSLSKEDIEMHTGKQVNSFVFPGGGFSFEVLQLSALCDDYLSARTSMRGYNTETPADFYALKSKVILNTTSVLEIQGWVDITVEYGYWTLLMYHYLGYTGSDSDLIEYNSEIADFNAVVDYAATMDLWIDTQENISKYIKERNAVVISELSQTSNSLSFILEDDLDDVVFDMPLTLRIELPSGITTDSVLVEQDGESVVYERLYENGISVCYAQLLPNSSNVAVRAQISTCLFNNDKYSELIQINYHNDGVLFKFPSSEVGSSFQIYSSSGIRIFEEEIPKSSEYFLNSSVLSAGMYIIFIEKESKSIHSRTFIVF